MDGAAQKSIKEVLRRFKSDAWKDRAEVDRFVAEFPSLDTGDLEKLLELLVRDGGENVVEHRNRTRAFDAIVRARPNRALFEPCVRAIARGDEVLRGMLAKLLPVIDNPEGHRELCKLLASPDQRVRKAASEALAHVGTRQTLKVIEQYIKHSSFTGRIEALDAVVKNESLPSIQVLCATLEHGDSADRIFALRLLREEKHAGQDLRAGLRSILALLTDSDLRVVQEAITVFALHCPEGNWFRSIAPFLEAHDLRLVKAAVASLGRFTSPRAVQTLERAFRIGPNAVRLEALRTAQQIGNDSVLPMLVDGLAHTHISVRNAAAETFANLSQTDKIDSGRAILWLLRSRDPRVRQMAAELLNKIKNPEGDLWPKLLAFLRDEDWWVRERLVDALVEMAGQKLTRHVVSYLRDPSDVVRRYAVNILARIKDPESIGALVRAAQEDADWWVREQALAACGKLGDPRAVPYVLDLMSREPELRLTCLSTLKELKSLDAAPYIGGLLESEEDITAILAALDCLDGLDDREQAPHVLRFHDHPDRRIRELARKLLDRWKLSADDRTFNTVAAMLGKLELLLYCTVEQKADDLLLSAGRVPYMKRAGEVVPLQDTAIGASELEAMILPNLSEEQKAHLDQLRDVDFSYQVKSQGLRFRANVFKQSTGLGAVFRVVADVIPDVEKLGIPKVVVDLTELADGLIVVAGATGSGKSTTLAALVDRVNRRASQHVITLEDPIEAIHHSRKSLVTQREIGTHSRSYGAALRGTLRQDPNVILVGEMRDLETISFAVNASETGHLVLTSLHAISADKSIERIINVFPGPQQAQIRSVLALSLRGIVCQQLIPRLDGNGRVLAAEVLLNNDAVARMIRDGRSYQLQTIIETSRELGMQSMDSELKRLFFAELISAEDAYVRAIKKEDFQGFLQEKA